MYHQNFLSDSFLSKLSNLGSFPTYTFLYIEVTLQAMELLALEGNDSINIKT